MNAITYSNLKDNLSSTIGEVCDDHAPVIITQQNNQNVVIMSLDDYESLDETAYLLNNPKNAERLLRSINSMNNGLGKTINEKELVNV